MRPVKSLLVNKGVGRGSSWSSLDLETLESDVSSGKSAGAIAKDCGWPSSSVRQRVAAIKRGDPSPRYVGGVERRLTPELLDEIRELIEEEHGRISVKIMSNRFTLSRTSSRKAIRLVHLRPLVIRTVPHLQDRHIRDRRKFAEEMLARLVLGSGRRIARKISTSRRLDMDVICFSDEKIVRVDAAAPGRSFHTFYRGKVGRRNNATSLTPFRDTPCEKGGVALLHIPPRSGLPTSPWTLLAAMMRGPLSHPICCQATSFCGGFERDSRCIGFVILSSLSTCHEMCHLIPRLPLATN